MTKQKGYRLLKELDTPLEPIPLLTPPALAALSKKLIQLLSASPPETLRQILRGIVHEIHIARTGNTLHGMLKYRYPFDPAPTLPMRRNPVGAPLYRQRFSLPFEVQEKTRS